MDLLYREVTYPIPEEKEAFLSMVGLSWIKIFREHIHVQAYYLWQIVDVILTHHNFL
jgi:hypothetical protein